MPAITDIPVELSIEELSHAWHTRSGRQLPTSVLNNLRQLLAAMESDVWPETAIHYRILPVTGRGPGWLALGDVQLDSTVLSRTLHQASHLVFGVCTLGQHLVHQVRAWFAARQHLQAVLLDEIGTMLLYKVSDYFEFMMCEHARSMGLQASGVLNPGDEGFDINLQGLVLDLAGGGKIGVTLQGSGTLVPHKSLTAVLGLGEDMPSWTHAERCEHCRSRERCPHRRDLIS